MSRTTTASPPEPDVTSHAARRALWCVVAAAALVLVYEVRHMWFGGDEWFVITDRGLTSGPGHDGVLEPFNEHWTTLPILAFRGLYAIVGLRSYWPYVALVIVAHLVTVVMLWILMRRARIDEWVALGACAVFAVLGIGSENLLTAWQVTLVASLAFGFAALVVAPATGSFAWRDGAAALLLLASLTSSGVGLPLLGAFAIVSFVQRGWRIAAATLATPAAVYALWYLAYGSDTRVADPTPGEVPRFVWEGLTDALGDVARLDLVGVLVVVAVVAWLVRKLAQRPLDRALLVPGALALAGVVFLASTGWRRGGLPGADPAIPRYAYVTVAFVLPLVAMAAQPLFRGDTVRRIALGVVTVALVVGQVRVLDHAAEVAAQGKRSDRGATLATAALVREGRGPFVYERPLHPFEPQVTVDEIVAMDRDGKLPSLDGATRRDRLTVLARLELALQPNAVITPAPDATVVLGPRRGVDVSTSTRPGCVDLDADAANEVVLRPSAPAMVVLRGDGLMRMWLRDETQDVDGEDVDGEAVATPLDPDTDLVLSIGDVEGSVVLSLPEGGSVICGVG